MTTSDQSTEHPLNHTDDQEICKLIHLLLLRVECLNNENPPSLSRSSSPYPTIKQVDDNLIEYLYYLFNKFVGEDVESNKPTINKTNFVNVCQTLVRNGCLNIPLTNSSEATLFQTVLHEYQSSSSSSSLNEPISTSSNIDQDTWLVVDFEPIQPKYSSTTPDLSKVRAKGMIVVLSYLVRFSIDL